MKKVISSSFSVSAQKSAVSIDHIDNYYLLEASGTPPYVNDTRWRIHRTGETIPIPTSAAPFLWHKSVTYLSDGTHLEPVIEFGGSLGQNGIDYDLVPSHSSILKAESGTLNPSRVSCNLVKRNADGSAEQLSSVPAGYSVLVYVDTSANNYTIGTPVATDSVSVISFVLRYGNIEIERHDIRVIAEGGQGVDGRGIQSQDYRFKANSDGSVPSTPTNNTQWNTWSALSDSGYSSSNKYLFRCLRTVYINGNGTTETTYLVDGPTVWGTDGKDIFVLDLDNEMDSVPCDSTGKVTATTTITTHARLYRGDTVVNSGITAPVGSAIKIDNATPSVQVFQGIVTISWTIPKDAILSSDHITVSIPVTYDGKQYVVVFTLNVVKSGSPGVSPVIYSVIPSVNACPFTRDANDALTPASYSVACGYSKTIGSSVITETNKAGIIDSNYRIFYRYLNSNGAWSGWIAYSVASNIPSGTTYTAYEFCIASVTSAADVTDSNILDREVVPITKSGARGNDGTSALSIDLSDEQTSFGTSASGAISAAVTRETYVSMFYGTTPLDITLETSASYEDGTACGTEVSVTTDNTSGKVSVTLSNASSYTKTIHIDITAKTSRGDLIARYTLQPVPAGADGNTPTVYQLLPSPSALSFERDADGNLIVANKNVVTLFVKKIEGDTTTVITTNLTGYRVYYGYGNPTYPTAYVNAGNGQITVSAASAETYTSLVVELWQMNGSTKVRRIDRETIAIHKDGSKGKPGEPGNDGNGIKSITTHRMHTPTLTPPATNDSGWIALGATGYPSVPAFNDINHYLWEKRTITYTKNSNVDVQIVLVASYDSNEIRPQLLLGTAFDSEETMTDWEHTNGVVVPEALHGQNAWGFLPQTSANYYDLLRQKVYVPGDISKIQSSLWYTLSFYARDRKMVGQQSNKYGFAKHSIYLMPGTYRLEFNGRCSAAARASAEPVSLNGYIYNSDWTNNVSSSIITTEDSTTKTSLFTVTKAALYEVQFYAYKGLGKPGNTGEEVRVNWFRVICESRKDSSGTAITGAHNVLATYLYPSALDNTGVRYMDGTVITTLPGDGCVFWNLDNDTPDSDGWTRHWVSFKTRAQIASAEQAVLFRGFGAYIEIAAVKLERGIIPTAWCEHNYDSHTECSHNPCGKWRAGTTYYYCNGQRDVVRAKASAGGGDTWWRMKRRTAHTGYISNTEPYADTEHWERGNNLKFSIVDAMFAEEVITDKLTVTKFYSTGDNSHIEMQNGVAEFFGVFAFPNIRVGVDSSGCSILEFYGADGQKMYDLGPNGLSKIDMNEASFTEIRLMLVKTSLSASDASTVYNLIKNITKNDTTAYYQFSPKRTTTGTTTVYWYGGTSHPSAPSQTGKCYQSTALGSSGSTQDLPTGSLIPNGWYAKQNDGKFHLIQTEFTPENGSFTPSICRCQLYYYFSGKQTKTGYVQWETDGTGNISNITLFLG